MLKLLVVNKELNIGAVKVISISGSSVFLVGDTQTIDCSSVHNSGVNIVADSTSGKPADAGSANSIKEG
ncbi:hypothetical protein [Paenibacillus donghaensis]|uniref:Uncharacterized protein n=1 Tax=Paenibacillus donghaensis TaxID=414771 RepID=A0A2Z2K6H7_9BACL|nr:hypothetical protein [Paenibacillus donghaensis]ASA21776.1 hypothetical protein B9T62_13950 [Paenibacillus donghaensis]